MLTKRSVPLRPAQVDTLIMRRGTRTRRAAGGSARCDRGVRLVLARVADERGVALIMSLGILSVLTILLTESLTLTMAAGRHAQTSNADQKAYALAEAGLNNALAELRQR